MPIALLPVLPPPAEHTCALLCSPESVLQTWGAKVWECSQGCGLCSAPLVPLCPMEVISKQEICTTHVLQHIPGSCGSVQPLQRWAGRLCLLAGKLSLCSISSAQPTALLVEMLQGCRGHPSLLAAPLNWQGLGLALFCSLPCPRASPTAAGLWLQVRTELGEQHRASPSAVVCSVPGVRSGQTRPRRAQSGLSQASCIQATLMG